MSVLKTQSTLIKHFNLLTPSLPTGFEGVSFDPPDTTYQRVQFRVNNPDDPVLGKGYYRERIEMQVFVYTPVNNGSGEALARAELIRQHFKKGTTLPFDIGIVHILQTPHIAGTTVIGNRIMVPVLIDTVSEILCN